MQNDDLKFFILNSDKNPLYINASDHVQAGSGATKMDGVTPANLENSPDKWHDIVINWARNNKYLGLFRDFSIGLKFVKDGAKIVRSLKWNIGMEAISYLSIFRLNRLTFPDKYDHFYTGELDFSKPVQTDTGVTIDIVEGGLSKMLKAFEGTTFDIPISTDPDKFSVYLDGLTFKNTVEMEIYEQKILGNAFIGGGDFSCVGMGSISVEGTSQGVVLNDENQTVNEPPRKENCFFQSFTKTGILNVSGLLNLHIYDAGFPAAVFIKVAIRKNKADGTFISESVILPLTGFNQGHTEVFPYTFAITFEPGTFFTVYADTPGSYGANPIISGTLNYDYLVRFDPTLTEAISWFTLFERLVEKMTKGKFGVKSDFLKSLTDQCITSGQAIRQYKSISVIKTSMADFFQACKIWGVGLDIQDNVLIIEKDTTYFRDETIFELGEVTDMEISDATDLDINTIKVGYKNQTYDNVNGKDEFNVTQQYTTSITRVVKELDLTCPYRADMFGIELTRLKLFGKDTTDNSADNDTFIMNVTKGAVYDVYRGPFTTTITDIILPGNIGDYSDLIGKVISFGGNNYTVSNVTYLTFGSVHLVVGTTVYGSYNTNISSNDPNIYKLNRPEFSAITGLVNPSEAFNILLSPKEILKNNYAYLASLLDMQEAGDITFQSGEKNSLLSRTLNGITTTENSNIPISSLGPKLFKPYYFKFKTQVDISIPNIIKNNPYGKISFSYMGNIYKGFMWDTSMAISGQAQEWQLLAAPENDMRKLI
jgi:hypothetical protein